MNTDPRETIDQAPMSLLQIFIIAITIALNGLWRIGDVVD